jgi:murein L,D-transpeptidase YcbB/YkuD
MFSIKSVKHALLVTAISAAPAAAQAPMEIVVNIPAGRLDVIQGDERVKSYPVSVGTPRHATPTADASVRRMVWNPSWTPPASAWARDEKPAGPGWNNPMGRVKIHLFQDYYVHGTPARNERHLGRPASHGCIRMRNADVMELAQIILKADGHPVDSATVQRLVNNPRATRELALSGRVKVRVEYRLAEVDADSVTFLPDVYARARGGYAARVRDELRARGAESEPVLARLAGVRSAPGTSLRVARATVPVLPVRTPSLALEGPQQPQGGGSSATAVEAVSMLPR